MLMLLSKFVPNIAPLEGAVMATFFYSLKLCKTSQNNHNFFNYNAKSASNKCISAPLHCKKKLQIRCQKGAGTKMNICLVG